MSGKSKVVSIDARGPQPSPRLTLLKALSEFEGAPDRFLDELLTCQCRLAGARCGVILRSGANGRLEILASHPELRPEKAGSGWIATAIQHFNKGLSDHQTLIAPLAGKADSHAADQQVVIVPFKNQESVRAAAAFVVQPSDLKMHPFCIEQLEITPFLLKHYELRLTVGQRQAAIGRLGLVLEILAAVNRTSHFGSAAMALCNELASRLDCNRVSLGFLEGRCVHVRAISNTDSFSREMQLVQNIEAAMEECLDQDVEIIHPAPQKAEYADRATAILSTKHGPAAVLSLPMRRNQDGIAVLTLERPIQSPFDDLNVIETVRLACELCTQRLFEMHTRSRWFGFRLASGLRKKMEWLVGPEHAGWKLSALAGFVLAVVLIFARGEYRIETPFVFQAPLQQVVVAPFDTFIRSIAVEPGDRVEAGRSILGELDSSELRLELAAMKAEKLGYDKQMAAHMRDGNTAEAQIANAQSQKCVAQIQLLEQHIKKATLIAPISGRLVSEDLKRQIGAPVETGKILFEIARINDLRAELYVPEDSISNVSIGQEGLLACVGRPDQKIRFLVEQIHPMAEVVNDKNVFRVRARLQEHRPWMRPGMEGIAKIQAGKKPYLWIGSHRLTNWLRMKLWL